MNFELKSGQLEIILAEFKRQPSTIEYFMDWYGMEKVDEFILDNNNLSRDHDWTDYEIEQLNEVYSNVRVAISTKHNL